MIGFAGSVEQINAKLDTFCSEGYLAKKFEEAEDLKRQYIALENFRSKSEVVSYTITDVDVFTITEDDKNANFFVNFLHVKNGSINQSFTFEYKSKLEERKEDVLLNAIAEIRNRYNSDTKEVIVPFELDWPMKDVTFTIPKRGDKKHLLELSEMNGKQYKFDRLKQSEKLNPEQRQTSLMKELQDLMKLDKLPYHIECFDNSNISGSDAVAACVVFKAMKPSRKDYRKYNIKSVVGPDDYASMQEVVRRRYTRMMEEQRPLPDLLITDGGKGGRLRGGGRGRRFADFVRASGGEICGPLRGVTFHADIQECGVCVCQRLLA
mgnify:CR=1 FL=1